MVYKYTSRSEEDTISLAENIESENEELETTIDETLEERIHDNLLKESQTFITNDGVKHTEEEFENMVKNS